MITVRIGGSERSFTSDPDESWINQQINGRRADGQTVCVQVSIETDSINVRLTTPTCSGGGGGGRQPSEREREVLELWEKLKLNAANFHGGNVVAFLKQVRRLL